MSWISVKFVNDGDEFTLGDFGGLHAPVLERARHGLRPVGSADNWRAVQHGVVAATTRDRVFPPVVGPIRSADGAGQEKAWHRVPAETWLALNGSWHYRSNTQTPIDVADLIVGAARLAEDVWSEMQAGNLRVDSSASAGMIYAPAARLWLLPGGWLRSAEDLSGAAGADPPPIAGTRLLARSLCGLLRAVQGELSPGGALDTVRFLADELQKVAAVWPNETNIVLSLLHQAAGRLHLPPLAAPAAASARPTFDFKADGDYRKLDDQWLAHPCLGFKRYLIAPVDQVGGRVPDHAALNIELAKRGDLRVLECRKVQQQSQALFVFSAPAGEPTANADELLTELIPAATAAVQAMPAPRRSNRFGLEWVRLMEDDRGVCCTWKARPEPDARFHVWWSSDPLDAGDWDAIASRARNTATLDAGQRQFIIEVDTPQQVYAAMGMECRGERSAVKAADAPCRARPRKPSAAPVAPASPPIAAPPPALAAGPAQKCPGCQAEVPAGRKFCPKCGGPMAGRTAVAQRGAPPPAPTTTIAGGESVEVVKQLERAGQAIRSLVRIAGREREMIDAHSGSSTARLWQALDLTPASNFPPALPSIIALGASDQRVRLTTTARSEHALTWLESCSRDPGASRFVHLPAVARHALDALNYFHVRGWSYGLLFPEHLLVDSQSEAVRLAWPLAPLELGKPASVTSAPAGYVCPEYGRPEHAASPNWDLYALAITLLWGLAGKPPPESLTSATLPELNARIFVPDLPTGWGGWFARLLSKRSERRFATAVEALAVVERLSAPSQPPVSLTVAAGLHVGVTKIKSNPHNQDRLCCAGPAGSLDSGIQEPFEGYGPAESYSTSDVAFALPAIAAVADGVSTVDTGEFASAAICELLHTIGKSELSASTSPLTVLTDACDRANENLGIALSQAIALDATRQRWLTSFESPSSTLASLLLTGPSAAVAGAGDSRVYLVRHGLLEQLTVDGDQLTEYLRDGLELSESLQRDDVKEIVGWVGRFAVVANKILPDQPMRISQAPGFWRMEFVPQAGDVCLVCTDGLSDFVDAGMIDLLPVLRDLPPSTACRKLVTAANECGGLDNIGVLVIRLNEGERGA